MLYTAENTLKIGKPAKVYLNGEYLKDAYSADPDNGFAVVLKRNADGEFYADESGELALDVAHGDVKVVFDV